MSRAIFEAALSLCFLALLAACGAGMTAEDGAVKGRESTRDTTREVTNVNLVACNSMEPSVLEQDARWYAKDQGIPIEEAKRRLRLEGCFTDVLANLERQLRNKEADTFAGLWIQHQPEYRYVVLFTRAGEETIRPYLEGTPQQFRRLIEVRSEADATLTELHVAQHEADRLLDRLDVRAEGTGIDVQKNHAVIYVSNQARFEATLQEAGAHLPEHVGVVEIEGHITPS